MSDLSARAHPSHKLAITGSVLWCRRYAAYSQTKLRGLRYACLGRARSCTYASEHERLRRGLLPTAVAGSGKNMSRRPAAVTDGAVSSNPQQEGRVESPRSRREPVRRQRRAEQPTRPPSDAHSDAAPQVSERTQQCEATPATVAPAGAARCACGADTGLACKRCGAPVCLECAKRRRMH
jgi:hypothetical protein